MKSEKIEKLFYINHRGELLIWLIILLIIVIISFISRIVHSNNDMTEHKIFMPDVDGLIVGSPVRTMGVEVGHVTKIVPVKDEVLVHFIVTNNEVNLPRGTDATVEFSGLAGSKSLELYLPDQDTYIDSTVPHLTVSSPRRLSDAAGLLNEMFKSIGNIIAVTSQFGTKLSEIDFPEKGKNFGNPTEFLKYSDSIIDEQQKRADDLRQTLDELGGKLNGYSKK